MECSKHINQTSSRDRLMERVSRDWNKRFAILLLVFSSMGTGACLDPSPEPGALDPTGDTGWLFLLSQGITAPSLLESNFLSRYTSTCVRGGTCAIVTDLSILSDADIATTGGSNFGVRGADSICNERTAALGYPSTVSWKAMLSDGLLRVAFPGSQFDWVLNDLTTYELVTGSTTSFRASTIGTTNTDSVFDFPLSHSLSDTRQYWTGINQDWSSDTTKNCSNWTSSTDGQGGRYGSPSTTQTALSTPGGTFTCDSKLLLVCVQQ